MDKLKKAVLKDTQKNPKCSFNENGCINPNGNGCFHNYCDKYKWIIDRAELYAAKFKTSIELIIDSWEDRRDYWYMNFYQESRQPNPSDCLLSSEWLEKGYELFGKDKMNWKFVCPSCGHVAKASDWKDAGAPEGSVAFSCVGRWISNCKNGMGAKKGPCNYAGGGLFGLNKVKIIDDNYNIHALFEFAEN